MGASGALVQTRANSGAGHAADSGLAACVAEAKPVARRTTGRGALPRLGIAAGRRPTLLLAVPSGHTRQAEIRRDHVGVCDGVAAPTKSPRALGDLRCYVYRRRSSDRR